MADHISDHHLLMAELQAMGIRSTGAGYRLSAGDDEVDAASLEECQNYLQAALKELKTAIWNRWEQLAELSQHILKEQAENSETLDNLLFLNAVKKSHRLARLFPDLKRVAEVIGKLLDVDVARINTLSVQKFNRTYIDTRCIHRLIMRDLYRSRLIKAAMKMHKAAQIAGPWSNLDLPMAERVWSWDDGEEEYFQNRQDQRRAQQRYNPESATPEGYYYIFADWTANAPYSWDSRDTEDVYKRDKYRSIP